MDTTSGTPPVEPDAASPISLPSISEPLIAVFKAGGIPLALIFFALIILMALIQESVFAQLANLFQYLMVFLLVAAIVIYVSLSVFEYLRWKQELQQQVDRYNQDRNFHTQITKEIFRYAHELAKRGLTADERKNEIESFIKRVQEFTSIPLPSMKNEQA